jgi:hypothetical protein
MLRNLEDHVTAPLCIYAATAIWCWLMPSRVSIDAVESVLNVFPTKALALATAAMAIVHAAFAFRGRLVLTVACLWALATTWMVTMFLAYRWLSPSTHSVVSFVYGLTVGGAAFALCVLGWHLVRRRLAVDANWFARAPVILGIAGLAFNYAVLALRSAGVLEQPSGLSATADVIAGLTVDLWINSAILVIGAVIHVASSNLRSQPSAA